jgi:translation elongation factor EF-Tu-like GTPase
LKASTIELSITEEDDNLVDSTDAEIDDDPVILTSGSMQMENGSFIIDVHDEIEDVVEMADNELAEPEEMDDDGCGQLILGAEEIEDWEQVEQEY